MKRLLICLIFVTSLAISVRAETVNFDSSAPGSLPPGWLAGVTGDGSFNWSVEKDATAPSMPNVLKQSATGKFPWCVNTNISLTDGHIAVKFKPLSGKEDQAGGLIWRWQDGDNYYIARANALENNVILFHTVKGVRKECIRVTAMVESNKWHRLRVDFHGTHFVVTFDGAKTIQWDDDTFKNAGAVGVWTKADSVTEFDDFTYAGK